MKPPFETFTGAYVDKEPRLEFTTDVKARWKHILVEAGLWNEKYDALNVLILVAAVDNDPEVRELARLEEFTIRPDAEHRCEVEVDWKKLFKHLGPEGRARMHERLRSRSWKKS